MSLRTSSLSELHGNRVLRQ